MADIWMDVDTALAEVPVNLAPLIDDTDFKTIEDAVAYNATGMDLRWNFVTCAGAYTSTAVTPTTGGNYDWAHQGDGMYSIEIPASGGASINNDTEGFGWFSGKATGVLPWRGPVIGFRAVALNDALIDGGDVLDVNLVQVLATALTETAGGYLAAGIKKFFDVASPTSTMNLITAVTTATNLTNLPAKLLKYLQLLFRKDAAIATDNATELSEINANGGSGSGAFDNQTDAVQAIRDTEPLGTAMRGTDNAALASDMATVLTRLSSARAGYLDNLNVGGIVASQADILGITQAARVRVCPAPVMERPDAGSTAYRVWIYAYNEAHQAEDLDSNPTVTAENNAGTDRSANLGTVTKTGTGIYYVDYTIASSHAIESLVFKVAATEGAVTTNYPAASMVVDTTAVDFTAADRSKLEALNTDWTDGGRLDLLVDSILARIGAITGSGDNTLLGFFKAALNKAAATPSDIGGTFAPSTDSLEALRDTAPMGTAMRGTDGANTTTPPTVAEIRAEMDSNSTKLALLQKLMEADYKIDKTTDPAQWKLVIYEKNTSTVLLTKNLKSVDGVAIANATTAVGQEVHAV